MEAATVTETQQPEVVATTAQAHKMFRYSAYLDVGEGAEECEHSRDGQCTDIEHFHAWCRLPNPFQHTDIRDKGLAAKARKLRELRDRESNAAIVLDEQLDRVNDPAYAEVLVDELVAVDWPSDYLEAQRDIDEQEEFKHILQDREEYARLTADGLPPEEERSEELRALDAHLDRYMAAIKDRLAEIQEPKRLSFADRSLDSLISLVRGKRVDEEADRAFLEAYDPWMWFVGTFKVEPHHTLGRPHLPMWEDIGRKDRPAAGTMFGESPEVITALRITFNRLSVELQRGSAGN